MGVVSGREKARESKAGTHYKFIFCTIPVHFLVSRHVVAQLLFFLLSPHASSHLRLAKVFPSPP